VRCERCGANFDTLEQRLFTAKLRTQFQEEKRREEEDLAKFRNGQEAARIEEAQRGEAMLRDLPGEPAASNALAALSLIPDARRRRWVLWGVVALLLALPALVFFVPGWGAWKLIAVVLAFFGWIQFLPVGWTRRRWPWLVAPALILFVVGVRTLPIFAEGAVEMGDAFKKSLIAGIALLGLAAGLGFLALDGWRHGPR
jgi:hypothetical protein